ncbi:hypothetical protein BDR05DRAFT_1060304 [Suillus weaverae]|nr:hypothetical protein BDR05DRAFT_1060304 [Suillus weaverae]
MTSYQVTEDLLVNDQGFRPDADVDSDDSDFSPEEEYSPEPEELIQGPSASFSGRGKQKADTAGAPPKNDKGSKKDQSDAPPPQIAKPRQTDKPPPTRKPNPANYPK